MKRLLKSATVQHMDEGSSVDKAVVDQRIEELSYFNKQLSSLCHLCKNVFSTIQGKIQVYVMIIILLFIVFSIRCY